MSTKTVKANKSNFITLKTSKGSIVIKTLPKIAPNHVKRIKDLVSSGFYNGIVNSDQLLVDLFNFEVI